jgi:predicted DNA-binding ribbon-helix-helix protein
MRPEKRSFSIQGHRTSISLEKAFWPALKQAASEDGLTLASLINAIDRERADSGLSCAGRVWLLRRMQARVSTSGDAAKRSERAARPADKSQGKPPSDFRTSSDDDR